MALYTRHRDRAMAGPLTTTRQSGGTIHTYYGSSSWGPVDGDSEASWEVSDTMDDCVTPGWTGLMRRGLIVNNDMAQSHSKVYRRAVNVSRDFYYTDHLGGPHRDYWSGVVCWSELCELFQWDFFPFLTAPVSPSGDDVLAAKELALTDAFASVSEAIYLSGQDAAEARQTIRMIVSYMKDAYRLLRSWRSLRAKTKELSGSKELASQWLRYRYGLRPLMLSIRQAAEALQSIGKPKRFTSRGFRSLSGSSSTEFGAIQLNRPGWGGLVDVRGTFDRTYLVSAGVLYENITQGTSLQQAFGLRIDDILPTAWELVKYSFVIDWFCNIGQVIRAWSPHSEARVLTSWVKTTQSDRLAVTLSNFRQDPNFIESDKTRVSLSFEANGGGEVREYLYVTRQARPEKPVIPHLELRVDVTKLLDILALIRQLM